MQSHIRHSGALGVARVPAIKNEVSLPSSDPQYYAFDDGLTFMRKGARYAEGVEKFGVDIKLTDSPGFNGIEDIDYEMIYPIIT